MRQLLSVNIARPRTLHWQGRAVRTGIYKEPVEGRVAVHALGLAGDLQADRRVHGDPRKAVYVYPEEHYSPWQSELELDALPPGSFGENLTTRALAEEEVCAGDRLLIGSAVFEVTQPRTPCFKLALKFERPDMIERMLASGRSGFYLAVVSAGEVWAGAPIEHVPGIVRGPSIAALARARAR